MKNNRYKIKRIYNQNRTGTLISKLLLLNQVWGVKEGMYILAVNGKELTADTDIYSLFDFTVDKQIWIAK
ncbi:PDZ domain-containing protein [Sphingobacterium daejeonense]|uniref:PDZ domain-containing protein n=1 Tax=Sphingobacterium daejeonense TaxID=371142 RepID=UPI001E4596F5|nr:PDZ domain-containing protein [Sphingobacterium daejeonense]